MALTQVASGLIASVSGASLTGTQNIPKATLPTGSVLQVVSTTFTDSTTIASTTLTDITGASASITPSNTNSKILIYFSVQSFLRYDTSGLEYASLRILRGSTTVQDFGAYVILNQAATSMNQFSGGNYSAFYLDSPSSTSALTYKLQANVSTTASTGRVIINEAGRSSSSNITLMEIAA
jgi:hypothetical protein